MRTTPPPNDNGRPGICFVQTQKKRSHNKFSGALKTCINGDLCGPVANKNLQKPSCITNYTSHKDLSTRNQEKTQCMITEPEGISASSFDIYTFR